MVETKSLDKAADIIDSAVEAGANRIDSVYFSLSPQKQIQFKDLLLEEAVKNAKSKAEKALAPLNHKIIGVKAVSLSEFGMPPPMSKIISRRVIPIGTSTKPEFFTSPTKEKTFVPELPFAADYSSNQPRMLSIRSFIDPCAV